VLNLIKPPPKIFILRLRLVPMIDSSGVWHWRNLSIVATSWNEGHSFRRPAPVNEILHQMK